MLSWDNPNELFSDIVDRYYFRIDPDMIFHHNCVKVGNLTLSSI